MRARPKFESEIDFWSMPICTVPYASHLDPHITRGALFSHYGSDDLQSHPSLKYVDELLDDDRASWLSRDCSYRGSVANAVSLSLHHRGPVCNTTALVALDSSGLLAEQSTWVEIVPALRNHYGRIIGHFHIPDRGFHHWKRRLSQSGEPNFSELFIGAASQCDAVIFTSQSLLENDVYLSARNSTDMLVAELMARLCSSLSDNDILNRWYPLEANNRACLPSAVPALTKAPLRWN